MSSPSLDVETRINIALAVGRYLRAVDHFDGASEAMTRACSELRQRLERTSRFVVQVEYRHYIVTSDHEGNFEVEQIESL